MFEKVYRTEGLCPADELQALLRQTRASNARFAVTLGSPPFERDGRQHITGIRLRFTPMRSVPSHDAAKPSEGPPRGP